MHTPGMTAENRLRPPEGAELLFQVLTEREERSAVAIASNEPFPSCTKTFTDPRLCAAVVDRLSIRRADLRNRQQPLPARPRPPYQVAAENLHHYNREQLMRIFVVFQRNSQKTTGTSSVMFLIDHRVALRGLDVVDAAGRIWPCQAWASAAGWGSRMPRSQSTVHLMPSVRSVSGFQPNTRPARVGSSALA